MAILTLCCIVGAVLGTVWLSQSRSRSCYELVLGRGGHWKAFSEHCASLLSHGCVSTPAYALMCLPNPSSTLFCAVVQVASEGACSG
jgi:hypothetical protein